MNGGKGWQDESGQADDQLAAERRLQHTSVTQAPENYSHRSVAVRIRINTDYALYSINYSLSINYDHPERKDHTRYAQ